MDGHIFNPHAIPGLAAARGAEVAGDGTGFISRLRNWLDDQRRYRRTVTELSQLTDRELDDIGLRRVDIASIARTCVRA